jgi:heptosyltransferase-3
MNALLTRMRPLAGAPFAVLHPYPKYRYKMWTPAGWIALAQELGARGLAVVFTGGPEPAETAYVDEIIRALPGRALNLAGTLSLAETAELIRRARLYVGPDTAVTHIAAATGRPTIALFGPSNPVKWGPWPSAWNSSASPWPRRGSGRCGNVYLLQGPGECVPCLLEGCERHLDSSSDCLDQLAVGTVLEAVTGLLAEARPG